ncbi:MAG: FG-GAP repeat protein [Verrucomicrobia bacterium]|nr:FG-GAP repeat protein [Verrucomicrobiota bacterium]
MPQAPCLRRWVMQNIVVLLGICLCWIMAATAPARGQEVPPFGLGDGLPLGLGDREPTAEEEAYLNARLVTSTAVKADALAMARAIAYSTAEGESAPLDTLPTSVDNSTLVYMPPIRSQGSQGSCTAWAAAYYYNTYTQARDHDIDVSGGDNDNICSPAFIYPLVNGGTDGGAYTPYVVALLNDIGCASWTSMPYSSSDWTTWPTEAAWLEALTFRTLATYQINGSTTAGLDSIKQHLANGNVAVTRFQVYSTWYNQYPNDATGINNRVYYAIAGSLVGGHAVTIVGYDDDRSYVDHRDGQTHTGAFLIANSWGTGWGWYNSTGAGTKGFFWVGYNMFLESTFGPYAYYSTDRADYSPTLYAAVGVNHTQRGRVALRGGIGPTSSPEFNSPYPLYNEGGNTLAITDEKRVVVDLTDAASLFTENETKQAFVRLTISALASSSGTITSADFYNDLDGDGIFETTASTDPTVTVAPGASGYAKANVSYGEPAVYVDDSNTSGPWYGTYTYPYQTIQDGLDAASGSERVIVMNGTYSGAGNSGLDLNGKDLIVESDRGPSLCTIDCAGVGRAFIVQSGETSAAVIDGFTIINGDVSGDGGAVAVYHSDPTIRNCVIYGNRAVGNGGAIYFEDSLSAVVNCIITGNLADGGNGGAIYTALNSDVDLVNCTVAGNAAASGGAIYVSGSDPTLTNCILWDNVPDEVVVDSGSPTLTYCDVEGGWGGAGGNNIAEDPLFYSGGAWDGSTWTQGDYYLRPGSPCIDSGWGDNGTTVPVTDVFGASRRDDADAANTGGGSPAYVDVGARERQGTWCIAGVGDFNGNGKADLLWYNGTTGQVGIWLINGYTFAGGGVPASLDPSEGWTIKGVGDFNGDGKDDVLLRETTTGQVAMWFMNGLRLAAAGVITTVDPASGYEIKGVGDLNGNGKDDIVWHNTTTGEVAVWLMNGGNIAAAGVARTVDPASSYEIQHVADYDGDGRADILWRKTDTGAVAVWIMNGTSLVRGGTPGTVDPASAWTLKGTGDFDGDAKADLVWYEATTGYVGIWLLNGTSLRRGGVPAAVNPADGWEIKGVGDFNGDGKADLVWRSDISGSVAVWLMNGLSLRGGSILQTIYP